MLKTNLNNINLVPEIDGIERQNEIIAKPFDKSLITPKTVEYKDIDNSFKEWVENDLKIVSDEGVVFPTITLFSNQRFSEYMQSWAHTDENKNMLLNFKTINRENNPQYGKIQNGYYNIPISKFFHIKRSVALDDNGNEFFLDVKMRQPMAIDIVYKLVILTTKYEKINEFNTLINKLFSSRQVYISPNGYYMPMVLENISDESQYQIDDRQFYSQSFSIKAMGFIITQDDFCIEENPLKIGYNINSATTLLKKPEAEIEECEPISPYYYKPIILTINFPVCKENFIKFSIDMNFTCNNIQLTNILNNYRIFINGNEAQKEGEIEFNENDEIKIMIKKRYLDKSGVLVMNGFDRDVVYNENKDFPESDLDTEQTVDNIIYQ